MSDMSPSSLTETEFNLFRAMIYKDAGISLGDTKHQLVESRLSKRLRILNLSSYTQYYKLLMEGDRDGSERLRMINCLTTNKTDFFRESHHFDYLRSNVFPRLEKTAKETGERRLRIWSAACSTGEEPYTLAMTVLDHFGPMSVNGWDIRILASDVDTDVLAHAHAGTYSADRVSDVPRDVLKRHFLKTSNETQALVQVKPELQELITFRRINFIEQNWPVQTYFDIIFCRNVMIYFDEKTQDTLLSRFSDQMVPEGHLFIGHSESILRLDHIYKSLGDTVYCMAPGVGAAARGVKLTVQSATAPIRENVSGATANLVRSARQNVASATMANNTRPRRATLPPVPEVVDLEQVRSESIIVGEVRASAEPLKVTTLVGSCIAVCLFDPALKIGGMNHFMLPANTTNDVVCATYGIHAMELLINEIMKLGGDRRRLNAKIFGGGNVLGKQEPADSVWAIGERNIQFALEFLKTDGIPIVAQDVGGLCGRQVQFVTHTGQAFVRPVEKVVEELPIDPDYVPRWKKQRGAQSLSPVLF